MNLSQGQNLEEEDALRLSLQLSLTKKKSQRLKSKESDTSSGLRRKTLISNYLQKRARRESEGEEGGDG